MRVLRKESQPMFCGETLVDYYQIFIVDHLPKERQYIEAGSHKGFVVSVNDDDETNSMAVYLEKQLDDWNNQLCEICDVVYVREEKQ